MTDSDPTRTLAATAQIALDLLSPRNFMGSLFDSRVAPKKPFRAAGPLAANMEVVMSEGLPYPKFQQILGKATLRALALCVVALMVTLGYPDRLRAQTGAGDITLAPGASASLYFKVYCIEFGMPLTEERLSFEGRSEHGVADILHYAHWKGYVDTNPAQVSARYLEENDGRVEGCRSCNSRGDFQQR
jgi:hypothetical protein